MDVQLLLALVLGIATIVVLVLRTRLDAFVALLIAALVTGFVAGSPVGETITSITTGFGNTLASIGIVIGLGVAIGKMLEVSGAADALARTFVKALGKGREHWAMAGTGAVVSIPVFCDSGYVIMNPLARSIARRLNGRYVTLALALGCGMTLTHHLVPPTPGPLGVAGILGADLGGLILAGLVFAVILIPVVIGYAAWIGPKLEPEINETVRDAVYARAAATSGAAASGAAASGAATGGAAGARSGGGTAVTETGGPTSPPHGGEPPSDEPVHQLGEAPEGAKPHRMTFGLASLPLFVPLLLIVLNTVATAIDRNAQGVLAPTDEYTPSTAAAVLAFVGNPVVALTVGIILAVYVLLPRWTPRKRVHGWLADAAASAGLIILITGAGGALGQVLRDSGVGDALAEAIADLSLPAVLIPFVVASLVRLAQGSGTVAMITAASVTAPLVAGIGLSPLLAALACCAGSMVFSYFNDSYFWVVTRFTGLDGTAALRGWSGITTAVWAASLPLLLVASLFL
ncbi:GntP family permease [Geodermatophilus sp. YIM 151500]|uniref:GntP family permease n=1 Tax=Geodermatophilus sp. YIM 151500 TaxID=2984531 RepID=UPI0021E44FCF|nr:GntP family permease [Geodermatophilus sp. YIM 151500]MCV2490872.1 GntP family permease [Geodermatophilus sp. YIM 151500]